MKKITAFLRRPFRVSYRLSVLYHGETVPRHTYGNDGHLLLRRARTAEGRCHYWTLYKTGPFGLPEREVDSFQEQ